MTKPKQRQRRRRPPTPRPITVGCRVEEVDSYTTIVRSAEALTAADRAAVRALVDELVRGRRPAQ